MDRQIDWTLARSFLAVAEARSLSGAARALGMTQPSLGRHIEKIEHALSVTLFHRAPRGVVLTPAAEALLPHARAMRDAAQAFALAAAAREEGLAGTVRITASRVMAHYTLPPIIADLRRKAPQIEIDLIATDETENLLFRQADIALRMYPPTQLDLVAKHVRDVPMALYGSPSLLESYGPANSIDDILKFPLVGFDKSDLILRMLQKMGYPRQRSDFKLRCDDQLVHWQLVTAGAGIGAMQCEIGDREAKVTRVTPHVYLQSLPLWLAAQQALLAAPRMRFVFDHLAEGLAKPPDPFSEAPFSG
jgi:DNA-binding transcriptional LysR family regulator